MSNNSTLRKIAVTMGCPVGVGPEILIKSYQALLSSSAVPIVVGDISVLKNCADRLGVNAEFVGWHPDISYQTDTFYVCQVPSSHGGVDLSAENLKWGEPTETTGKAMASYITYAVQKVRGNIFDGVVTCPITKTTLNAAGYNYPGHTEMLADLCKSGSGEYAMMMAGKTLKVTLVTIHQSLRSVPQDLSVGSIHNLIDLTGRSLQLDFGIEKPAIAVAGLNPHAGEGALFGSEEEDSIRPAVQEAAKTWNVDGPFPPDTVFNSAVKGLYDAVVCMYHDQGLIPFKLLHFADGVNVTIGLPIVRTSVDHGTAYDIAGKGIASPESLIAAYEMALDIVNNRAKVL